MNSLAIRDAFILSDITPVSDPIWRFLYSNIQFGIIFVFVFHGKFSILYKFAPFYDTAAVRSRNEIPNSVFTHTDVHVSQLNRVR